MLIDIFVCIVFLVFFFGLRCEAYLVSFSMILYFKWRMLPNLPEGCEKVFQSETNDIRQLV